MASWKKILTYRPAVGDLASGTANSFTFLRGDGTWGTPSAGSNYFLNGISKSGNTLTFAVSGASNQTYAFGSNAFTSTSIPTGALAALNTVDSSTITDGGVMEVDLKISNSPTDNYILSADTASGGFTWVAPVTNTDTAWNGGSSGLNAATGRTSLGLVIGTNVQAYDAQLDTWATVSPSSNGKSLVAAADYAAMRVLLGAGTGNSNLALGTSASTALAGNTTVDNVSVTNLKSALASDMGGTFTVGDSNDTLNIAGNLTVSGTTTTINTATLDVEDANIALGKVSTPSASTANGGGITVLSGASSSRDPKLHWKNGTGWVLYERDEAALMPLATVQVEDTSGSPSGLQNAAGRFAYNSADGEMYFYDAS